MSHLYSPSHWRLRAAVVLGALITNPLAVLAQEADEVSAVTPPSLATSRPHDWLIYVAIGLGLLNLLLLYMLFRSPRRKSSHSDPTDDSSVSSRTDKRMEKRKREIDELRHQVDDLSTRVATEAHNHLNVQQIQELVRTLVKDELNRQANSTLH